MTDIIKLQQPEIIDDGTAPEFRMTGLHSVIDHGTFVEVTYTTDDHPSGKIAIRMTHEVYLKWVDDIDRMASGKSAEVIPLRRDEPDASE
jgi:hypothetical protein